MPNTERVDDPTISGNELLWHRVHPAWIKNNPESGEPILSSGAFRSRDEVSVSIASLTTLESVLENYQGHSLAQLQVGFVRSIGCIVVRDPLPDNPAHALVCGKHSGGRLSKAQAKQMANKAQLVVFRKPES